MNQENKGELGNRSITSNFQQQQEEHHKPRNNAGGAVMGRV
jgi:hypothetical protein